MPTNKKPTNREAALLAAAKAVNRLWPASFHEGCVCVRCEALRALKLALAAYKEPKHANGK